MQFYFLPKANLVNGLSRAKCRSSALATQWTDTQRDDIENSKVRVYLIGGWYWLLLGSSKQTAADNNVLTNAQFALCPAG